jgi:hypothetical protein
VRHSRRRHLKDPFSPRQIPQPLITQIDQRHTLGEPIAQQLLGAQ